MESVIERSRRADMTWVHGTSTYRKVKMVATRAATPATMVTARAKRLPVPPVLPDMMKTGEDSVARILCSMFGDSIRSCRTLLRAGGRYNSQAAAGVEYACLDTPTVMQTLKLGETMRVLANLPGLLIVAIMMPTPIDGISLTAWRSGNRVANKCQQCCRSIMTAAASLQVGRGLLPQYSFPS